MINNPQPDVLQGRLDRVANLRNDLTTVRPPQSMPTPPPPTPQPRDILGETENRVTTAINSYTNPGSQPLHPAYQSAQPHQPAAQPLHSSYQGWSAGKGPLVTQPYGAELSKNPYLNSGNQPFGNLLENANNPAQVNMLTA